MKVTNGLNLLNRPITNLADPSANQDAATKNYVDSVIRGASWKEEVVAASTGNVSLASPGTSLDGITLTSGNRILLKDQTAQAENGIYVWTGGAAALTRAADADTGTELSSAAVTVQRGTVNADKVFVCSTDDPISLGTTVITWVQLGGAGTTYTPGNGISISGGVVTAVAKSNGGLAVDSGGIYADTTLMRRYAAAIGDGSTTGIVVTHNLGTRDVTVAVYDASTNEDVLADIVRTSTTTVTITFATAPATGAYRVVIMG